MRYYVVSDPHGFYTEMTAALRDKGFFDDEEPHKLLLCGDAFDRGREALQMQEFLMSEKEKGELIYIRGNHEDLFVELIDDWYDYCRDIFLGRSHHVHNGTVRTALDLTGYEHLADALINDNTDKFLAQAKATPFYSKLIPSSIDYFETEKYIFVHGWIPCEIQFDKWGGGIRGCKYDPDWRKASDVDWKAARWLNGIDCAESKVIEPNKTIVCGHWHCSYGHFMYGDAADQFGSEANFLPFEDTGILAIDACTAASNIVNCIVVEDEPI